MVLNLLSLRHLELLSRFSNGNNVSAGKTDETWQLLFDEFGDRLE
jgi:hypothetical protein